MDMSKIITKREFDRRMEAFHEEYGYIDQTEMAACLTDIFEYTVEYDEYAEDIDWDEYRKLKNKRKRKTPND
jgi:hypothetical protein